MRWCSAHTPASGGLDDEVVAMESYPAGSGEAGGPDYLMQFVETRVVTENTLRRGFASNELV